MTTQLGQSCSSMVWIWTQSKEVMTASVERGWNTFVFSSKHLQLANDWSWGNFFCENRRVATIFEVLNLQELLQIKPENGKAENIGIDLLDCKYASTSHLVLIFCYWVIPAENIVAAFQDSQITVFAISKSPSEAQIFLEALEQGLGGVILKVEDAEAVPELKRNEVSNLLSLTKATVTRVQVAGMGD
ncbi:3-dehydroquinate synthase [Fagus crenata]